jgi:hypothetical protein
MTIQLPSDVHYAIIDCDECGKKLAKLFKDCQGCYIEDNFFNLCKDCWDKYLRDKT